MLFRSVNDLEIELRGRCRRREQEELSVNPNYIPGASSRGSGSQQSREKSRETVGRYSESPYHGWHRYHNTALNAMNKALRRRPFTVYGGKTNLIENVSHYIHMMPLFSHNDGLMCKVFQSNLG